jgi:hypothetical protein
MPLHPIVTLGKRDARHGITELSPLTQTFLVQRTAQPNINSILFPKESQLNRTFRLVADNKDQGKSVFEQGVRTPLVKPKACAPSVPNVKLSPQPKEMFNLVEAFPKLQSSTA